MNFIANFVHITNALGLRLNDIFYLIKYRL